MTSLQTTQTLIKMTNFIKTDGGRTAAGFSENNDCAVRAYALFKNVSYKESHDVFKKLGRKDGKGTKTASIWDLLGRGARKDGQKMTLNALRRLHPTGTVYALKRGHAFTMINGVVHDSWKVGDKTRIMSYWVDDTPRILPSENVTRAYFWTKPAVVSTPVVQPVHQYSTETPVQKKANARATFDRLNAYGTLSPYQIAKRIATELNITVANANYYVSIFTGKR